MKMAQTVSNLVADVRFGVRVLRSKPATTLLCVAVLGVGIGANSAMFNLVNALLLRPLVAESPEELVGVYARDLDTGNYMGVSYPDYVDLREQHRGMADLAAHRFEAAGIEEEGVVRRSFVNAVSSNFFQTFGVAPILGRDFLREEELPGSDARVVVLSHGLWKKYGGDESVLGRTVNLNSQIYTIVGVAPAGFAGTSALLSPDLFLPLSDQVGQDAGGPGTVARSMNNRENRELILIGRLPPGTASRGGAVSAASNEAERVAAVLREEYPATNESLTFEIAGFSRVSISTSPQEDDEIGALAALLLGMAFVVLLVAALNLATVQGARSMARSPEIAVRLAMGSGRWPVIRQLLIEGFLLALCGGAFGLAIAWSLPRLLETSFAQLVPFQMMLGSAIDWRLLLATFVFCSLATLLFGLTPALQATKVDLNQALRQGGRSGSGQDRRRLLSVGNLPVILEVAFTLVLLVAGGLFLKGSLQALNVEPGFELKNGVMAEVDMSFLGWTEERGADVSARLRDRLREVPGVESVSVGATIPFGTVNRGRGAQTLDQPLPADGGDVFSAQYNAVGRDYFETLGIPMVQGRGFQDQEPENVVIIDTVLAEKLYPEGGALGSLLRIPSADNAEFQVVGVVATIRDSLFDRDARSHLYVPFSSNYFHNHHFHLKFGAGAEAALPGVRDLIREVDGDLPVLALRTLDQHLANSFELWTLKIAAQLFGTFAAVALLMAIVGVYGVRAFSVVQRTRELGIRMALGSSAATTLWLILRDGLRVGLAGGVLGLALALGVSQLLSAFLVDVGARDPWVFGLSGLLLLLVVAGASWIPARRAAALNPLEALRYD